MTSNFCKYLSNQVRVEYGQFKPCCWFTESVDVNNTQAVIQFQKELSSIVDWDTANGRCDECKTRESKGLFSPRTGSLTRDMFSGVDNNATTSIEIQIDRDCNAACLICGPWNSTTWEKYEHKIKNIPIKEVVDSRFDSLKFVEQLSQVIDFSEAREILFLGGEPLRTDSHVRLLENVKSPSNTIVKYTTNGSYRPDSKTIESWKKFKEIHLQFSIDGVGEHFNYLRWPLQWSQVESNLEFLINLQDSNIKITSFSYTTTPFSLFYHDRYEEWARTFFHGSKIDSSKMFDRPWQPRGITPMSLSAVPPTLQQEIKSKYGPGHSITQLLEPFKGAQFFVFMEYIKHHDSHRKTNWKEVFPEMADFYLLR